MKIVSWNVNGLRSATRHGFLKEIQKIDPDILCLQEIKANESDVDINVAKINGYTSYYNSANKKGYAGTAVYTKLKPLRVISDVLQDQQINDEGRTTLLEFRSFSLLNVYVPHGGRDKSKIAYKLHFYSLLKGFIGNYTNKPLIITGDLNIAHKDIDLARPRQNRNNTMFTAEERAALQEILDLGYIDTFRHNNKDKVAYSWWPYLAQARERNIGWRIDYILASRQLEHNILDSAILNEVPGSDHCPVKIDLNIW